MGNHFITLYQNWSPILRMPPPPLNTCFNKFMMAMMPHLAIPNFIFVVLWVFFFFFINFSFPVSWWFWYWINTWIQVYSYLTLNNRYNEVHKKNYIKKKIISHLLLWKEEVGWLFTYITLETNQPIKL